MIKQAKAAGADIAKFQVGWRFKPGEINQIDLETLKLLERCCNHYDIEFMVSLITDDAFELAKKINFNRYKVASRTVKDNIELVKSIVSEGKETIISLGMWEGEGLPIPKTDKIKYLWCKSLYPAHPWDLSDLPKDFSNTPYDGYSDHSIGIEIPLIAISRGAKIIEKHFTLDKSDTTIRDHVLSATPDEFKLMTQLGRNIHRAIEAGV